MALKKIAQILGDPTSLISKVRLIGLQMPSGALDTPRARNDANKAREDTDRSNASATRGQGSFTAAKLCIRLTSCPLVQERRAGGSLPISYA
jgi:hypothetical protein